MQDHAVGKRKIPDGDLELAIRRRRAIVLGHEPHAFVDDLRHPLERGVVQLVFAQDFQKRRAVLVVRPELLPWNGERNRVFRTLVFLSSRDEEELSIRIDEPPD